MPYSQMKHEIVFADGKTPYSIKGWDIVSFSNVMGDTVRVVNGKEVEVSLPEMVEDYKNRGAKIVYDTDDAQEIHPHKDD